MSSSTAEESMWRASHEFIHRGRVHVESKS